MPNLGSLNSAEIKGDEGKTRMAVILIDGLSMSQDALLVTDYASDYSVRGNAFNMHRNFSIASGATLVLLFDHTLHTSGLKQIMLLPPRFGTTAGEILINSYEGGNYAGGTPIYIPCTNRVLDTAIETVVTSGPTGTVKGTLLAEYLVGSNSTNQFPGGDVGEYNPPIIRDNSKKTLYEIINQSGQTITFNFSRTFYEL